LVLTIPHTAGTIKDQMDKPDMLGRGSLSRRRFERLVWRVLATLPEEFLSRLENVAVGIEDEPPEDMADTMGLYEGVPLTERSLEDAILPDRITLFKGPIERSCCTQEDIEAEVRLTVLHEVGHFFGLEEAQLE
jgi:predicted Zn-dependent protease with MMP-like domain